MAKIIYTAIVSDASKKIGDVVFTKNHYGSVVRKRVKPINPRSAAQTSQRTLLRQLAQAWKGIGQANIIAWNTLATQITKKDRLGVSHSFTGESLFISLNLNKMLSGGTYSATPPSINANNVQPLAGFSYGVHLGSPVITWTNSSLATAVLELRSPGLVSPGRTYMSKFKTYFYAPCNIAPNITDINAAYIAAFGTEPTAGQVTFIEARVIDTASGFSTLYEKYRVVGT
jgi:hypothetical protein